MLVNLVVNSIQAMPEGGKITIKTLASEDNIFLVIEDTGIGMSEDVISKVFIPFLVVQSTISR